MFPKWYVNSFIPETSGYYCNNTILILYYCLYFQIYENAFRWVTRGLIHEVNIGSANGLVPSGNKPLIEPILTQIYIPMESLDHNELKPEQN